MKAIVDIFAGIFNAIELIGRVIGGLVLILMLLVSAFVGYIWLVNSRQASFTFKISLTGTIDGKPTAASAVQKIVVQRLWGPLPNMNGTTSKTQGSGVYLPIDANSGLALLMGGIGAESRYDYAARLLSICGMNIPRQPPDDLIKAVASFSGPCEIVPGENPMLIGISNLADMKSIFQINDLSSVLVNGHVVSVSEVNLERVDGPVDDCSTFRRVMPWLFERHPAARHPALNMDDALREAKLERMQLHELSVCSDTMQ